MTGARPTLRLATINGATMPDEIRGMTFEQWVEVNAERIWMLMRAGDCRDRSFNDVAERLWSEL